MGSRLTDSDRSDLLRLENIARHHKTVGTAALSLEAGITPKRVCDLLTNYFSSVSREVPAAGPSFSDVWVYTPTMADKAAEHESHEQENQLDRQRREL
jgi:hypothetical protein